MRSSNLLIFLLAISIASCSAPISEELRQLESSKSELVQAEENPTPIPLFKPEKISFAFVEKDELFGMVNSLGEEIIPPVWQSINYLNEGMLAVEYDSGIIEVQNLDGEKIHVFGDWERIGPFSDGITWMFTGDSKLFLMDTTFTQLKQINPLGFGVSTVWGFNSEGLAPVCAVECAACASGPCGIVNTAVEIVVDFKYRGREISDQGSWTVWENASVSANDDQDKGIVDSKGELIFPIKYQSIHHCGDDTFEASIYVGDDIERIWIKPGGEEVFDGDAYDYVTCIQNKELIMVRKESKYGFLNPDGDVALPLIYDELFSYQGSNDLIGVVLNGEKYFVDKNGERVNFVFEDFMSYPRIGTFEDSWTLGASKEFSQKDHEMFLVNEDYEIDSLGKFSYFRGISGGVAIVRSELGKYSIIHKYGRLIDLSDYDDVDDFFYP